MLAKFFPRYLEEVIVTCDRSTKVECARSGLGCFKQEGDRVSFEDPVFEGIVVGSTLRFTIKPSNTNTAYAFRSGRFLMHKDGKSFIGSINTSLNPDDNDYPVTATLDKSFKKKSK